jgi:hypothetical protein
MTVLAWVTIIAQRQYNINRAQQRRREGRRNEQKSPPREHASEIGSQPSLRLALLVECSRLRIDLS